MELEVWPGIFLIGSLVLHLLMQWVQWDAHHWDPLVQLGQWSDQVRCCSLKAEAPILEKLDEKSEEKKILNFQYKEFHNLFSTAT